MKIVTEHVYDLAVPHEGSGAGTRSRLESIYQMLSMRRRAAAPKADSRVEALFKRLDAQKAKVV
jgi:hypothetical protein